MNVGILIEGSIRGYHLSNKRWLIPHLTTIIRLFILVGVKGSWEEEETCPKGIFSNLDWWNKRAKEQEAKNNYRGRNRPCRRE